MFNFQATQHGYNIQISKWQMQLGRHEILKAEEWRKLRTITRENQENCHALQA